MSTTPLFRPPVPAPSRTYHLSASQLKMFRDCPRAWWFAYVLGVKKPSDYAHIYGKILHAALERYQLKQDPFAPGWDDGLAKGDNIWQRSQILSAIDQGIVTSRATQQIEAQIAALLGDDLRCDAGMPLLAEPRAQEVYRERSSLTPTHFYHDESVSGIFAGLALPKGWDTYGYMTGFLDGLDLTLPVPLIYDHKTTKHRGYAKTPKKLAVDTQMLIYAAVALALRPDANSVLLRHNVFLKEGRDASEPTKTTVYQVNAEVTRKQVADHWATVIVDARRMAEIRTEFFKCPTDEQTLLPWAMVPGAMDPLARKSIFGKDAAGKEPEACRSYGGCPWRDACHRRADIQVVVERARKAKGKGPEQKGAKKVVVDTRRGSTPSAPVRPFAGKALASTHPGQSGPKQGNRMIFKKAPTPAPAPDPLTPPRQAKDEIGNRYYIKDADRPGYGYRCILSKAVSYQEDPEVILDHTDGTGNLTLVDYQHAEATGKAVTAVVKWTELGSGKPGGITIVPFTLEQNYDAMNQPVSEQTNVAPSVPTIQLNNPTPLADQILANASDAATHPVAQQSAEPVKRRAGRPPVQKPAPAAANPTEGAVATGVIMTGALAAGHVPVDPGVNTTVLDGTSGRTLENTIDQTPIQPMLAAVTDEVLDKIANRIIDRILARLAGTK